MAAQLDRIEANQEEMSKALVSLDNRFQIYTAQHTAQHISSDGCQEDHEIILRGQDKLGGLVVEANYVKMRQNIVFAILAALGAGFMTLLINAIVKFIP
jgi:hypothetical protein